MGETVSGSFCSDDRRDPAIINSGYNGASCFDLPGIIFLVMFALFPFILRFSQPSPLDKRIFVVIFVFCIVFSHLISRVRALLKARTMTLTRLEIVMGFLFLWSSLTLFYSVDREVGYGEMLLRWEYLGFVLVIARHFDDQMENVFLTICTVLGLVLAVHGMSQFFGVDPLPTAIGTPDNKVHAFFNHRNFFAAYLGSIMPYIFVRTRNGRPVLRLFAGLVFLMCCFTIIVTLSRSALIAVMISIGVLIVQLAGLKWNKVLLFGFVLLTLTFAFFIIIWEWLPDIEKTRLFNIRSESVLSRKFMLRDGFQMVAEKPFLGFGLATFPGIFERYESEDLRNVRSGKVEHLHNEPLEFMIEEGGIGLILVFTLLILVFFPSIGSKKSGAALVLKPKNPGEIVWAVKASLLCILIQNITDLTLRYSVGQFVFFCGIAIVDAKEQRTCHFSFERKKFIGYGLYGLSIVAILAACFWWMREYAAHEYLIRGNDASRKGDVELAENYFKRSLILKADKRPNIELLVDLFLSTGRFDKAQAYNAQLIEMYPWSATAHFNEALIAANQSRFATAFSHGIKTFTLNPQFPNNFTLVDPQRILHGQHEEMVSTLRSSLSMDPDNPFLLFNLYSQYRNDGKLDEAINVLAQLRVRAPKNQVYLFEEAKCFYDKGDFNRVIEAMIGAKIDPPVEGLYLLLAKAYDRLGESDRREEMLRREILVFPRSLSAYREVIELYVRQNRLVDVYRLIERMAILDLGIPKENWFELYKVIIAIDFGPDNQKLKQEILSIMPIY